MYDIHTIDKIIFHACNASQLELKVAQNSFQHLDLSLDATIMVSNNCPIIGEHVVIIFVMQ